MDERGMSGHGDGPDESAAWWGDHAHDAWTEDKDDLDHGSGDVEDAAGSEGDVDLEPGEASHEAWDEDPPGEAEWDEDVPAYAGEDWDGDPIEDPGRSRRSGWWLTPTFFAGAIVGMLVITLVWTLTATGSNGGSRETSPGAAPNDPSTRPTASSTPIVERREQGCADTAAALYVALRAAAPAMDQWEVHVGAMNKLVVGAISLQQANQFWNQTRVGAQQRLARFRAADRRLNGRAGPCPSPNDLGHAPAALRSCARVVAHDREALTAARKAVDTWSHHVHDMEMLRMGHMSPTMATHMWLASWKQGVQELHAYHSAVRAQHRQRCAG